jgi:hypothetical protein
VSQVMLEAAVRGGRVAVPWESRPSLMAASAVPAASSWPCSNACPRLQPIRAIPTPHGAPTTPAVQSPSHA